MARVPASARVPWTILTFVLRVESADLKPPLEELTRKFQTLLEELAPLITELEDLGRKIQPLLEETLTFRANLTPLWEDNYNLCGDPQCDGDCRVCQEGEYDGEEEYTEKYCRRGRR